MSCDSDAKEPSEEALLEAELARLQRSYRVMQNDYKAYKEETKRIINKQKYKYCASMKLIRFSSIYSLITDHSISQKFYIRYNIKS